MVLTRHTHSNYTNVVWLLVLAAQNLTTDSSVDKGYICDIPQTVRNVLLLRSLDRQEGEIIWKNN